MNEIKSVREQLLEHAIALMATRGYHGFSYRDLSHLVGVKTASIHYHFPIKADLVFEAVNRYTKDTLDSLISIDSCSSAELKLREYTRLFGRVLGDGNRICLCGMLAADLDALPDHVRAAVQTFFLMNENWLANVLAQGAREGTLDARGNPDVTARTLSAAYQGSVLASRLHGTDSRLEEVEEFWRIA